MTALKTHQVSKATIKHVTPAPSAAKLIRGRGLTTLPPAATVDIRPACRHCFPNDGGPVLRCCKHLRDRKIEMSQNRNANYFHPRKV